MQQVSLEIFDHLGDGYWIYDVKHRSFQVSARLVEILGLEGGDQHRAEDHFTDHIVAEDRSPLFSQLLMCADDPGYRFRLCTRLVAKDGAVISMTSTGVALDETVLVVLSRGAEDAATPLLQEVRENDVFLAAMAHDVRTPLNALIGFSELLANPAFGQLSPRQAEFAQNIALGARQLAELVPRVLELATIARPKPEHMETVPAHQVIGPVAEIANRVARKKQISIETSWDETQITDPVRMRRLIFRLVLRAVKLSQPQTRILLHCLEGTITCRCEGEENPVALGGVGRWDCLGENASNLGASLQSAAKLTDFDLLLHSESATTLRMAS